MRRRVGLLGVSASWRDTVYESLGGDGKSAVAAGKQDQFAPNSALPVQSTLRVRPRLRRAQKTADQRKYPDRRTNLLIMPWIFW